MRAAYVFKVRFALETAPGVETDPRAFDAVVELDADPPGEGDWLFFRDALWRGEVNDERYARELAAEWLSAPVESVSFRELRTDEEYLDALKSEIADNLDLFNSDAVDETLTKYLGSSIHVRP
ncbi:LWR-salt protein [Halopelagius fulvigenes]|uniref:LWR-salt protein n=1 Tax=Halopelagius fulvigenes TaxID=1198324 RepID=A0ABD5TUL4_9EURY